MAAVGVNRRAQPKLETPVSTSAVGTPQGPVEPAPVPVSRAKLNEIQTGMEKAAVIEKLGAPRAMMSIPDDGVLVETLTYRVEGDASAKVRLENGKVVSVKVAE
jgi:glucose/arabinose dehydrogenase